MMKISMMALAALLMCGHAMANFSGGDDFNDNAMDTNKWSVFDTGAVDAVFSETNSRLEFMTTGAADDTAAWEWIANKGSYTQDWSIVIESVNLLDETAFPTNSEMYFGVMVYPGSEPVENFTIEHFQRKDGLEGYENRVDVDGSVGEDHPLEVDTLVSSNSITLRIDFDSQTKTLHALYDEGAGFVAYTNYDISVWGLTDTNEFTLLIYNGSSGSIPVSSGEVYGDNLTLCSLSQQEIGDDFNDNAMDTNKWAVFQENSDALFSETNGCMEFLASGVPERNTAAWAWATNSGSYAQDWSITIDSVNLLDEADFLDETEMYFGLYISGTNMGDAFSVSDHRGNSLGYAHTVGSEVKLVTEPTWDVDTPAVSNSITLRIDFDARTKTLYSYYDEGLGFMAITNCSVDVWGLTDTNEFSVMIYNGSSGSIPVASGEVYGDNFLLTYSECSRGPDADYDGLPDAWELQYFSNPTNAAAGGDIDSDGLDNLSEYIAGTVPTNGTSVFEIINPESGSSGMIFNWNAVEGRVCDIKWTDSLTNAFQTLETIAYPQNSYTGTAHAAEGKGFYSIAVKLQD